MTKLVVRKNGFQKRLFFEAKDTNESLSALLEDRVSDDLDFRDTVSETIKIASAEGFVLIPH
mgnify:CR=1 FL=1